METNQENYELTWFCAQLISVRGSSTREKNGAGMLSISCDTRCTCRDAVSDFYNTQASRASSSEVQPSLSQLRSAHVREIHSGSKERLGAWGDGDREVHSPIIMDEYQVVSQHACEWGADDSLYPGWC